MYLKLALVGILLVLLSFFVKAEILDANQIIEKAKPEIGDMTLGLIKGLGDGFGFLLGAVSDFVSKYAGMQKSDVLLALIGISIIVGTFVFLRLSQSWGNRFLFVFIIFGALLLIIGLLPLILKFLGK